MLRSSIFRLSLYYRVLKEKVNESISSSELAELAGVNASQVRKDLSQFGQFGIRGKGYKGDELRRHLQGILGLDRKWCIALIGVGNLGFALLNYSGFRKDGFKFCAAFDNSLAKIGKTWGGVKIHDISELNETIHKKDIKIGIITVPAREAPKIADMLVEAGIKGILNFAPVKIDVPKDVKLVNVDLSIQLEGLSYYLKDN